MSREILSWIFQGKSLLRQKEALKPGLKEALCATVSLRQSALMRSENCSTRLSIIQQMWSDRDCISPLAGHTPTQKHSASSESRKPYLRLRNPVTCSGGTGGTTWEQVKTKALPSTACFHPRSVQTGKLTRRRRWKEIQRDRWLN